MNPAAGEGQYCVLEAHDPGTVCCEPALLVTALRTVGVALHPHFPFAILREEEKSVWRWVLATRSADGLYETAKLIAWWNDPAWLRAHPQHEFTLVRTVLLNMAVVAREVRETVPRQVVRHGRNAALIPENASAERRIWLLDQLHGRLPIGAPFPPAAL